MFAFSQIDPRTNGQVTDMEVPLSRYLGAAAAEGQNDSMFNSVRQWREMSLESSDPAGKILQPEEANKTYGLPGLKWDRPVKENVASLMNTRHQAALDRAYFLSQDNHSLVAGVLGMGTQMASAMMNPLDLGAMFIPFVGEAKTANVLGRGALRTAISRGLISHEAFAEAIPRGTELARSVVQGGAYMGMAQTPIIANRIAEGGPGPGLQDLESIGMGSLFAAGMHLGISGASRAFKFLDSGTREAAFKKAVDDFAKGQDTDVADIAKVGMDPEKVTAVAYRSPDGTIHAGEPGDIHPSLAQRIGFTAETPLAEQPESGFITNHGNFLTRTEAYKLVHGNSGVMMGEDLPPKLDSIQMSGVDEVNFGTSTRLAKAGDVEGLTKYLIAHGAPGDAAAREYALAWIEKERTKDPTKLNAIQARENGFAKQEGKILSQPVIEEKQGHSPTPEDAEIAQVKEDAAELRRQLEEAARESGMEVGEPQITAKTPEPGEKTAVEKIVNKQVSRRGFLDKLYKLVVSTQIPMNPLDLIKKSVNPLDLIKETKKLVSQTDINESLRNAVENGYDILKDDPQDIADDLASYDATFEGIDPIELMPYIKIWQESFVNLISKKSEEVKSEQKLNSSLDLPKETEDPLAFVKQKGKLGKQGFYTIRDPRVSGFSMQVEPDKITLVNLSVAEKGKGLGGEIIERVKKLADEQGKPVELIAHPDENFVYGDKIPTSALPKVGDTVTSDIEGKVKILDFGTWKEMKEKYPEAAKKGLQTAIDVGLSESDLGRSWLVHTENGDIVQGTAFMQEFASHQNQLDSFYKKHGFTEGENRTWRYEPEKLSDAKVEIKPATDSIKAAADCLKKKIL